MNVNITWTITAIIAVSSFLSPIAVAIINNLHHAKMRKLELEHDEYLRRLNLQQQFVTRQFDIYYLDKKNAFSDFMKQAGIFSMGKPSNISYESLHSSIDVCLLFCNKQNKQLLCDFQKYIDNIAFGGGYSSGELSSYSQKLNEISFSLNKELESTKPVI